MPEAGFFSLFKPVAAEEPTSCQLRYSFMSNPELMYSVLLKPVDLAALLVDLCWRSLLDQVVLSGSRSDIV